MACSWIRLDRIARDKHASLFGLCLSDKEKGYIALTSVVNIIKLFVHIAKPIKVVPSRTGSLPYTQILDQGGKASQGPTL